MWKLITLIPVIWFLIHLIPVSETDTTKKLLNNPITVPLEQNGDVYLKGFNVPASQSPIKYGQNLYRTYKNYSPDLKKDIMDGDDFKISTPDDILKFQGKSYDYGCWYGEENFDNTQKCPSLEELNSLINQNKILLSRLEKLWSYQYFDTDIHFTIEDYFDGATFIDIQQLFHAQLVLMKQTGQSKKAIDLWFKNIRMLNSLITGRYNSVDKAIFMISQGISKQALLTIIDFSVIDDNFYDRIQKAVQQPAFGSEGFNLKKTAQAEYNFFPKFNGRRLQKRTIMG